MLQTHATHLFIKCVQSGAKRMVKRASHTYYMGQLNGILFQNITV